MADADGKATEVSSDPKADVLAAALANVPDDNEEELSLTNSEDELVSGSSCSTRSSRLRRNGWRAAR